MKDKTLKLIDTIGSLYDAAIDPQHWDEFMLKAADLVDGRTGVLVLNPNGTPAHHLKQLNSHTYENKDMDVIVKYKDFPTHLLDHYMKNFFLEGDIWHNAVNKSRLNNEAWIGSELVPMEELRESRFYKEIFNANGDEYIVGSILDVSPLVCSTFSLSRGIESGDYTQEDKEIFELFVPHMQRARVIHSHYEELRVREQQLKEALNATVSAIALLDGQGKMIFANNIAEKFIREEDGFGYKSGRLSLADPSEGSEFYKLIGQCIETSEKEALHAGGGMLVSRPSEKPPYRMVVTPLNMKSDQKRIDPNAAVAMFIYDTTELRVPASGVLRSLYKLTDMEIKVASLFYQCFDLQKIAEELDLKISTVRTHFYRVLEKTETKSQPELMRLLDQLPRVEPGS